MEVALRGLRSEKKTKEGNSGGSFSQKAGCEGGKQGGARMWVEGRWCFDFVLRL